MAEKRMDLKEAGTLLGLTPNAVRARAAKQLIRHEQDNRGKWWVFLDPDTAANDRLKLELPTASNGSSKNTVFEGQIKALEGHLETMRQQVSGLEGERDDLRRRLDLSEDERRKLVAALIEKASVPAAPAVADRGKRRWWHFGRVND